MRNWPSKLLALFLAIVMWYFVMGEDRAEVGMTVPLELMNIPRDLMVINPVVHGIDLRVSGPRSLVRDLTAENIRKSLDLSNAQPGSITFSITPEGFSLPREVSITRIHPTQVTVVLAKSARKTVSVHPRIIGRPRKGFAIESSQVVPERVEITGPEKVLEKIHTLYTQPVDVEGIDTDLRKRVYPDFPTQQISLTKEVPLEVEIKIKKLARRQGSQ